MSITITSQMDQFEFYLKRCVGKECFNDILSREITIITEYIEDVHNTDNDFKKRLIELVREYYVRCDLYNKQLMLGLVQVFQHSLFNHTLNEKYDSEFGKWLLRVVVFLFYKEPDCDIKLVFFGILNTLIKNCDEMGGIIINTKFINHLGNHLTELNRNIYWEDDSKYLSILLANSFWKFTKSKIGDDGIFTSMHLEIFTRMVDLSPDNRKIKMRNISNLTQCIIHTCNNTRITDVITLDRLKLLISSVDLTLTSSVIKCLTLVKVILFHNSVPVDKEYLRYLLAFMEHVTSENTVEYMSPILLRYSSDKKFYNDNVEFISKILKLVLLRNIKNQYTFVSDFFRNCMLNGSKEIFKQQLLFESVCNFIVCDCSISQLFLSNFLIIIKMFLRYDYSGELGYSEIFKQYDITNQLQYNKSEYITRFSLEIENTLVNKSLFSKCLATIKQNDIDTTEIDYILELTSR